MAKFHNRFEFSNNEFAAF